MAYKFQVGPAIVSGSLTRSGSLIVKNDQGAEVGSLLKTGVLSASSDATFKGGLVIGGAYGISQSGQLTASAFAANWTNAGRTVADLGIVTTVDINGGTIDGATIATSDITVGAGKTLNVSAGTLTTSAAQDLAALSRGISNNDSNQDFGAFDVRAQTLTADSLVSGSVLLAGANGVIKDDSDLSFASTGEGGVLTGKIMSASVGGSFRAGGASQFGFNSAGAGTFSSLSASSTLLVVGNAIFEANLQMSGNFQADGSVINFPGVSAAAVGATDLFVALDASTKDMKIRTRTDVASDLAGVGLGAASGVLALDLNELSAAVANVANDSIAIIDADDSNQSKKESIADLVNSIAGTGITATNGVMPVDTTGGDSMSAAAIADGGTVAVGLNFFAALSDNASVTLPANPAAGDVCVIKAHTIADTKAVTINRGHANQSIDGLASLVLRSSYGAVTLIAATAGNSCDWRIA